jgi:hypothetical protein
MDVPGILAWDESLDEDFRYFSVYGSNVDHLDESATMIGYTIGTEMNVSAESYLYYHVTATDFSGNEGEEATYGDVTEVNRARPNALSYALHQNQPNPCRSSTFITFDLPQASDVSLEVYDVSGRRVITLVNDQRSRGSYSIQWNGTNSAGERVPAGVYFYKLKAGDFTQTRRMMIVR